MQDILDLMKGNSRIKLKGFLKIDRCVKEDELYIKAYQNWKYYWYRYLDKSSYSLCRKEAYGSKNKKEFEFWWKRRIKKSINKVREHINILESHQGEIRKKEKYEKLEV